MKKLFIVSISLITLGNLNGQVEQQSLPGAEEISNRRTSFNLDEIKVNVSEEHSKDIKLDDVLTLRMKYPSMQEFIKNNFNNNESVSVNDTFEMISACVEQIYSEEESWNASDTTKKELNEFLEQLTTNQFKEIEKFFETMPKLSYTIKLKNPNTDVESEVVLEGLTSFFA